MMSSGRLISPYLKPGRLLDIVAALQVLAEHDEPTNQIKGWANILSRDGSDTSVSRWDAVFSEHPEFFVKYRFQNEVPTKAALRLRYTKKAVDPVTGQEYSAAERKRMPEAERNKLKSNPLSISQTEMLVSTAIELHSRALEEAVNRRWWLPHAATIVVALLGILGTLGGVWFSKSTTSPSKIVIEMQPPSKAMVAAAPGTEKHSADTLK